MDTAIPAATRTRMAGAGVFVTGGVAADAGGGTGVSVPVGTGVVIGSFVVETGLIVVTGVAGDALTREVTFLERAGGEGVRAGWVVPAVVILVMVDGRSESEGGAVTIGVALA